jgi:hypothetical protein
MKRVVGRRLVDEGSSKMASLVIVQRRWPWQQEDFYSEVEGELLVSIGDGGVLKVSTPNRLRIYNPSQWKTVTSRNIPSRTRV